MKTEGTSRLPCILVDRCCSCMIRWHSCCNSCKQPISRTGVLFLGRLRKALEAKICRWWFWTKRDEIRMKQLFRCIYIPIGFKKGCCVLFGLFGSGMIDSTWNFGRLKMTDVFCFCGAFSLSHPGQNPEHGWMKVETQVNSGDIYIQYMYTKYTFTSIYIYIYIYICFFHINILFIYIYIYNYPYYLYTFQLSFRSHFGSRLSVGYTP